jgi:hypothetical protein
MQPSAFNFKTLVRELSKSSFKDADQAGVMLLLAIDQSVPEIVIGDMVTLHLHICYCIIN